ncbi:MAG: LptF/LptG family permease [Fimbriimonadaceae bacterium]
MKRIDKLIVGELAGPWLFGTAVFTTLIMAGTYMFKITDYLANGISLMVVLKLTLLLLPGVIVKTFSMAVLLSTLLAFGRLSSDSEIVALRAAGASLGRIMMPVGVFGVVVAAIAFGVNEFVVPRAAFEGTGIVQGIDKQLKGGAGEQISRSVYEPKTGKLLAMIVAKNFSLEQRKLEEAWVIGYGTDDKPFMILHSPGLIYNSEDDWEVMPGATMYAADLSYVVKLDRVWPAQIAKPGKIEDIVAAGLKDLDSFSMDEMLKRIEIAKGNKMFNKEQVINLEYGYYNKIALPLAAMIFGLVGAPLGIRNHRTGTAVGFSMSVLIIFGYMMLTRVAAIMAMGGRIHPASASFAPLVIGLVAAIVLIWRKNA